MFELDDLARALLAEGLDRGSVPEVIGPLHRVVGVVLPRVAVAERGVDPAFGGPGVAPHGVKFRDERDVRALLLGCDRRAKAGPARADHDDIVFVHCSLLAIS